MPKILIIADDLTGAADCGAVFAERGYATTVLLATQKSLVLPVDGKDAEVLSIDADTRSVAGDQAAACVALMVHAYCAANRKKDAVLIFKKVDSTLRGSVGVELAAALKAARARGGDTTKVAVLFAPAFPSLGRTTVNGRQLVQGEALEDSDEWRREQRAPHSSIGAMFRAAGLSSALVDLVSVRAGRSRLDRSICASASAADVVICDAETDTDLEAIVRAGLLLDRRTVWAGSAGLARQIASTPSFARASFTPAKPEIRGAALFVVGTPAAASQEQARALADCKDVLAFTLGATALVGTEAGRVHEETRQRIHEHLQQGEDVLLQLDPLDKEIARMGPQLARSLAQTMAPCADYAGALAVTGGDTARAILNAWGIQRMRVMGEVEPGLPYSVASCGGREILILTKAGGFGTSDTLVRCRDFIRSCFMKSGTRHA